MEKKHDAKRSKTCIYKKNNCTEKKQHKITPVIALIGTALFFFLFLSVHCEFCLHLISAFALALNFCMCSSLDAFFVNLQLFPTFGGCLGCCRTIRL